MSASLAAVTDAKADASIVVDASQKQSDCGSNCDDLSTLQNLFQDANAPAEGMIPGAPWYGPAHQMIIDLNMKRTRLLQDDVYCDVVSTVPQNVDPSGQNFGYYF
jgi:hypothetical protein